MLLLGGALLSFMPSEASSSRTAGGTLSRSGPEAGVLFRK